MAVFRSVLPSTARQERLSHRFGVSVAGSVGSSGGARTKSPSNGHPPVVSRAPATQALNCPATFVSVKKVSDNRPDHVSLRGPDAETGIAQLALGTVPSNRI